MQSLLMYFKEVRQREGEGRRRKGMGNLVSSVQIIASLDGGVKPLIKCPV